MIKPERLAKLAELVGEDDAKTVDALHTKYDGEIALSIKKGAAYVCKKPTLFQAGKHRKANKSDELLAAKQLVIATLVHPTPAAADPVLDANPDFCVTLAAKAYALSSEDEEFDLEGN